MNRVACRLCQPLPKLRRAHIGVWVCKSHWHELLNLIDEATEPNDHERPATYNRERRDRVVADILSYR